MKDVDGKRRVLIVTATNVERGGVQTILLRWAKRLAANYDLYWVCPGKVIDHSLKEEFEKYGVIVIAGDIQGRVKKAVSFFALVKRIIYENRIDFVHINTGSMKIQIVAMLAAKSAKVNCIIAHSRNTAYEKNVIHKICCELGRKYLRDNSTFMSACSKEAAEWLFGKGITADKRYVRITNPISTDEYRFNESARKRIRQDLHLFEDDILLGTVGAMNRQKNQLFLLEILALLPEKYKLVIIGDGELHDDLVAKIISLDLSKRVLITGYVSNVSDYLQAMDIYLMPSAWEGFGNAAIEAQASGLPCFLSDRFTDEVIVTSVTRKLPISNAKVWKDEILRTPIMTGVQRENQNLQVKESVYDFDNSMELMLNLYKKAYENV